MHTYLIRTATGRHDYVARDVEHALELHELMRRPTALEIRVQPGPVRREDALAFGLIEWVMRRQHGDQPDVGETGAHVEGG